MEPSEQIDRIRRARQLIAPLLNGGCEPQIEAILRSADMELHWSLWNLGEVVAHRSEMDSPLV